MSGHSLTPIYYQAPDGSRPVLDVVMSLGRGNRPHFDFMTGLFSRLTDEKPELLPPHAFPLSGKFADFRELRCPTDGALYRVIYRQAGLFVVLLHAFRLDRGPIAVADQEIALERWDDFVSHLGITASET